MIDYHFIKLMIEKIIKTYPIPSLVIVLFFLPVVFLIFPDFFVNISCLIKQKPEPTLVTVFYKKSGSNLELEALESFLNNKNAYIVPMPSDTLKSINVIECTAKTEKLAKEIAIYLNRNQDIKIKALNALSSSKKESYYPYRLKENTIVLAHLPEYWNRERLTSDNIDRHHCVK